MKAKQIVRFYEMLEEESSKTGADMYMALVYVFMVVADNPGATIAEIRQQTGYDGSKVTRKVA